MENNQRNSGNRSGNERTGQQDQMRDQRNDQRNEQDSESLNTASGLRNEMKRNQDEAGSGRSYDYGTEGSSEEDLNQQLGRNSNQQNVSNPISTPGTGNDNMPGTGRSDSRAGTGSGLTTKQGTTGSDYDGQNRNS